MVVIALLLPALVVLMLFGMDALENFLFTRHAERSRTNAVDPPQPLASPADSPHSQGRSFTQQEGQGP